MSNESRVKELRELFPVTKQWTYLYNGSIHPCPIPVGEAMRSFLHDWEEGGESAFFTAYEAFGALKDELAQLLHGSARNIVITDSITAGLNMAAQILSPEEGQNVVLNDLDFMTNTYLWMVSRSAVSDIRFVASRDGKIYLEDIAAQIDENTAAVNVCAVTVGSGFRFNLPEVCALARRCDVPLVVDGAQAVGVLDVNVTDPSIDFLAGTFSKWMMGPAGMGYLYLHDRYLEEAPPAVGWLSATNVGAWDVRHCELAEDASRFQGGLPNLVGAVGALAALRLLKQIGREFIEQRVRDLTTYVLDGLLDMGISVWTPLPAEERAGIVFFRVHDHEALHVKLKAERVYCGSFLEGIRVDPGCYNTFEELDRFLGIVRSHVDARS